MPKLSAFPLASRRFERSWALSSQRGSSRACLRLRDPAHRQYLLDKHSGGAIEHRAGRVVELDLLARVAKRDEHPWSNDHGEGEEHHRASVVIAERLTQRVVEGGPRLTRYVPEVLAKGQRDSPHRARRFVGANHVGVVGQRRRGFTHHLVHRVEAREEMLHRVACLHQSSGRKAFVMGMRRSRPKAFFVMRTPGGIWRRLYSLRSTSRVIRVTNSRSKPSAMISSAVAS